MCWTKISKVLSLQLRLIPSTSSKHLRVLNLIQEGIKIPQKIFHLFEIRSLILWSKISKILQLKNLKKRYIQRLQVVISKAWKLVKRKIQFLIWEVWKIAMNRNFYCRYLNLKNLSLLNQIPLHQFSQIQSKLINSSFLRICFYRLGKASSSLDNPLLEIKMGKLWWNLLWVNYSVPSTQ